MNPVIRLLQGVSSSGLGGLGWKTNVRAAAEGLHYSARSWTALILGGDGKDAILGRRMERDWRGTDCGRSVSMSRNFDGQTCSNESALASRQACVQCVSATEDRDDGN